MKVKELGYFMNKGSILIVEDEIEIQNIINNILKNEKYATLTASCSRDALDILNSNKINLILLDIMLPDIDGLNLCKLIKNTATLKSIPIIIITSRNSNADIVKGLSLGADDYITKPFDLDVLIARVKAVMRRKPEAETEIELNKYIKVKDIEIYPETHQVSVNGKYIGLTLLEFKTLYLLANNPGRVFSREQISESIHQNDTCNFDRSIDSLIVRLRKKLSSKNDYIETVWGIGYRFKEAV